MAPKRGVGGEPSKAPCWWCSRQLHAWHGQRVSIDLGYEVVVHKDCLRRMRKDPDWKHRVEEAVNDAI